MDLLWFMSIHTQLSLYKNQPCTWMLEIYPTANLTYFEAQTVTYKKKRKLFMSIKFNTIYSENITGAKNYKKKKIAYCC